MKIAIITARGGSKRVPGKNIRCFCGRPIISYSIEAALESGIFDEVMVSTDSFKIASIARQYGAKVPFMRSAETSDDKASTDDVLREVLKWYLNRGIGIEIAYCIYPTAPFITADILRTAIRMLDNPDIDCVMPVAEFSFPPQRGMKVKDGLLEIVSQNDWEKRSQDLETIVHDCGQFYAFRVKNYLERQELVSDRTAPIIISDLEQQDIDNESDWDIAEMKYIYLKYRKKFGAKLTETMISVLGGVIYLKILLYDSSLYKQRLVGGLS